jgi:hypothetical protein
MNTIISISDHMHPELRGSWKSKCILVNREATPARLCKVAVNVISTLTLTEQSPDTNITRRDLSILVASDLEYCMSIDIWLLYPKKGVARIPLVSLAASTGSIFGAKINLRYATVLRRDITVL